jgi:hypothetical protein
LPLDFGVAIHAGLEVYYEPSTWGMDREVVELTALQRFVDVCYKNRTDYIKSLPEGVFDIDPMIEQERFTEPLALGIGMLKHYFKWAPQRDLFTPVKVEIEFEVPIPVPGWLDLHAPFHSKMDGNLWYDGVPVVYQGRIDVLIMDLFGRYWIVDHKTAAQFGGTEYLEMDEQCGSYIWPLRKLFNLPVAGVIYNRLLKAVPHPPAKLQSGAFSVNKQQRTTYEVYKQTLIDNGISPAAYVDFLEFLQDKGNTFFQRIQVHRSTKEIDNLEEQICVEAIDMLNTPSIYPNPGLFNCMGCSYRKPCLAKLDGSDYQWILKDQFQLRKGEPIVEPSV